MADLLHGIAWWLEQLEHVLSAHLPGTRKGVKLLAVMSWAPSCTKQVGVPLAPHSPMTHHKVFMMAACAGEGADATGKIHAAASAACQ